VAQAVISATKSSIMPYNIFIIGFVYAHLGLWNF